MVFEITENKKEVSDILKIADLTLQGKSMNTTTTLTNIYLKLSLRRVVFLSTKYLGKTFLLCVYSTLPFLICHSSAQAEDLLEVYRLAKANDPQYLAAWNKFLADKQKLPQARALFFPDIRVTGTQTRHKDTVDITPDTLLRSGEYEFDSTDYSINLRQSLFNGVSFATLKQAKATTRKAVAEFSAAEQDLMYRVAEAYFGMLRANHDLNLATSEKTAARQQLKLTKARRKIGLATSTEVYEVRAQYELTEAQEIEATNDKDDAREQLRELTGQYILNTPELRQETPAVNLDPAHIEDWIGIAKQKNLTLLAADAAVEIARQEVGVQRAGHYPTLDIVAKSSVSDADGSSFTIANPNSELRRENNTVGVELNLPLFQGGLVYASTKEAKLLYKSAQQEAEKVRRHIIRETRASFLGVSTGTKKLSALDQAVFAGESALESKTKGFKAGIYKNQDVLEAQRNLFRDKRNYADALYEYILNLFRLKEAAGILNQDDLVAVNGWLKSPQKKRPR